MNNVSIKGLQGTVDRNVKLQNGSLVLHYCNGLVIDSFIVTSYRNPNSYKNKSIFKEFTTSYCSLISLDTGKIAFEEPSSRTTTEKRVLNHLLRAGYKNYNDEWETDMSKLSGHSIKVFNGGNYSIELSLGEEQNFGK
ncbi:MAG: hypothetical protein PHC95_05065 [Parabacteroides sp.]|nr:hypothetical protein [Parabacteroides sp.]